MGNSEQQLNMYTGNHFLRSTALILPILATSASYLLALVLVLHFILNIAPLSFFDIPPKPTWLQVTVTPTD